jgi:hypothetical protein
MTKRVLLSLLLALASLELISALLSSRMRFHILAVLLRRRFPMALRARLQRCTTRGVLVVQHGPRR